MAARMGYFTPEGNAAGTSRQDVPDYVLARVDADRLQRLERGLRTRAAKLHPESSSSTTPIKRQRDTSGSSGSRRLQLTETRHVVVEPFLNKTYVKIREYVDAKDGSYWSSPRGINLRVNEWKNLVKCCHRGEGYQEEVGEDGDRRL